jgi:hypothetical protein
MAMAALMQSYKLETADKSQVCDGSRWEAMRDRQQGSSAQTEMKISKKIDTSCYRPVRKNSLGLGETEISIDSSEEKRRGCKKSSSSFIPRASFTDSDNDLGFLDMSEKSKDHNDMKKSSQHMIERSVSDDAELHKPRARRRESTGGGSPDHASQLPSRRASSGHLTRDATSGYEAELRKLSKPSTEGGSPGHASQPPSRRASSGDLTRDATGGSKAVMRKLSKPMHRCSITNQSVSGIMRPARYSSNNLAGMNSRYSTNNLTGLNSASSMNLSALNDLRKSDIIQSDHHGLRRSSHSNASFDTNITSASTSMSNASWVANGVEFSKNMEVVSCTGLAMNLLKYNTHPNFIPSQTI